jgi:precorrin-6B methylase 2
VTAPQNDLIDDIAAGYQASQILLTANRLGVFTALAKRSKDHLQLADDLETDPRGTRILCDALVDLGLLERTADGYEPGEDARRHLLPDSKEPRRDLLAHGSRLYERWAGLYDAVKTGSPVDDDQLDPRLASTESDFARAMADVGRRSATATCERLDLSRAGHVLDLGGGPGIYAMEFARTWPELEVTVFDTPEALGVARTNLESSEVAERVHLRSGDAFEDSLGGPYGAIFISNVLHIYSAVENRRLIQRCASSLRAGGQLILKDFFLDEDRKRPPGGAIFAVNMLVSTDGGDCYTVTETRSWLQAAGLELEEVRDVASKSRLLVASKPSRG